jgi:methionyl-tRNA formyltransferase
MKLIFFGSPDFAVPSLHGLHAAGHPIELVVTRPDRPRGRSRRRLPTAVKEAAVRLGLPVFQPRRAREPEAVARVRSVGADLAVVAAYGEILTPDMLAATRKGFINVHASMLPDYRGAAPINWAIVRGETTTGVTVQRVVPDLDMGAVLAQRTVAIGADETAGELADRLAVLGAEAVVDVVGRLAAGEAVPETEQGDGNGFAARRLRKSDGRVDWRLSPEEIRNRVRGFSPWPGAFCEFHGRSRSERVVITRAEAVAAGPKAPDPGEVLQAGDDGITVKAGDGCLRILALQPAGKREMAAADFVRGRQVRAGDMFC